MKRNRWANSCLLAAVALAITPLVVVAEPGGVSPERVRESIEGTKRVFRKARFSKPGDSDGAPLGRQLAPLIVEESDDFTPPKIGVIRPTPLSPDLPFSANVIYFHSGKIDHPANKFDQVVYLWWFSREYGCVPPSIDSILITRGVRVVLDHVGMPILWEALTNDPDLRVFFVAQSLEAAAREQFGEPLPGRNFSIERAWEDAPGVVVVRSLDDGPVPMGPYVYIDAKQRNITTILCRCMDSQFEEAVETVEYQLELLESLDRKWLRETGKVDLDKILDPGSLEKLFRWPKL